MGDIAAELEATVRAAAASGTKLSIVAGGSKSFLGRDVAGECLDVSGHSGILDYQPAELVLTARAGTTLTEIAQCLEDCGQMLPFEPPVFDGKATIGGTLACDAAGPARPWRGSVRDATLGVTLINGRGERLRFGGQVLKNVAGYDVSRLQAGAMGTLGVMTEVTVRLLPIPAATATLVREMDAAAAIRRMNEMTRTPLPISAAAWLDGKLYMRLEGAERAVAGARGKLEADFDSGDESIWRHIREQSLEFFKGSTPLWRFSVASNSGHRNADEPWLLDWGGAQRWLRGEFDAQYLESLACDLGGQVSLYRHGDRSGEVFHPQVPAMRNVQMRLKKSFDPHGIFNVGRMYDGI